MRQQYSIPGPLVLALCIVSYYAGRTFFAPSTIQAPTASQGIEPKRQLATEHPLAEIQNILPTSTNGSESTKRSHMFEPGELEAMVLERSGLLKAKPPLPAGESGNDFYHAIPFQILSWYPRIVLFPNFVDKARCQHVIDIASKRMWPSGLAYKPGESFDPNQDTRTSSGTFMSRHDDPAGVLAWLEEKIAAATLLPVEHGEAFNVLRYQHQQHYDSHMDTFDPRDFGQQPSQRVATVLLYLSDVQQGGETVFKMEGVGGESRRVVDWRSCDDGSYKYAPRQGDAVLFWSVRPDGAIDPHALHGGCPVVAGEKWAMTKWLHDKRVG